MGFKQLEYQERVLNTLELYLSCVSNKKIDHDRSVKILKKQQLNSPISDFTKEAWEHLRQLGKLPPSRVHIPHSERKDGCARWVPNAVLKVPTGGGKTFLAVSGVSKILEKYLSTNVGFVLWIVPNEAIYRQTITHFKDRQHPYRQALDRASAGRVRIMEKTTSLNVHDIKETLCIMLLMLQSANRETKESLKIFQDRGDVHGFTPPEGEQQAHRKLKEYIPNLQTYGDLFPRIKDSLGNALRIIRPIVVLDEGHKAISDLAFETLYEFNPSFVLELTATPKDVKARGGKNPRPARHANLLVEVTGSELDREEMIKMPLILNPCQDTDWRSTLNAAFSKLNQLGEQAKILSQETHQYIRPILLVQVERTGKDQQESGFVHSSDVKRWLLTSGLDESEIAIKTAEQNDLIKPENKDLLSPTNRIRVIITKQALQEGWDCPFAYILCTLAASSNQSALTQLVGRILRQPGARKTVNEDLNQSYVFTHHAQTAIVVEAIKAGLKNDGLGDLVLNIQQSHDLNQNDIKFKKIQRRDKFQSTEIYLPKVMVVDGNDMRELDYETDVESHINWSGYNPKSIADRIPMNFKPADGQLQKIYLSDENQSIESENIASNSEMFIFRPVYAVQRISDIVPNPFVGREIITKFIERLHDRGFDQELIAKSTDLIIEELRRELLKKRDLMAEDLFKKFVTEGHIQFRLRLDGRNWRMPQQIDPNISTHGRQLTNEHGGSLERSLFIPHFDSEFNDQERDVAIYLDGDSTLTWWHRNVARSQYGIQGWKKGKVYPDFIFALHTEGGAQQLRAIETKGDHLGNDDTDYKRELLSFLTDSYAWDNSIPAGELELISDNGTTLHCELILMSDWKTKLPKLLGNNSS